MGNVLKLRIKFAKYGTMKFLGHLDVMRFFQKAIRRAGIDIRYSEGFSPHQIMSFAAPLGVGLESFGEYMDIEVFSLPENGIAAVSPTTDHGEEYNILDGLKTVQNALQQVMVPGFEIMSVTLLPEKSKNAMASVAAASYLLYDKTGSFPIDNLKDKLSDFNAKEHIYITKETKKNTLTLDLKAGMYELSLIEAGSEYTGFDGPVPAVFMLVDASSSGNIKPSFVWDAFCREYDIALLPYECQILRLETYTDTAGEGEHRHLLPLAQMGDECYAASR